MEKHKKKLLILALVVAIAAGAAIGTYAFKTESEVAHNIITTPGGVEAEIVEYAEDPDNPGQYIPYEDPEEVMPGMAISKIPVAKNTGDAGFYVRISVSKDVQLADGSEVSPDVVIIRYNGAEGFNTTDWTDGGDGFWYYKQAVNPGEETTPLFDEVLLDPDMDNVYQSATAHVYVQGQAVQSDNNGDSPLTAQGWPAAPTA